MHNLVFIILFHLFVEVETSGWPLFCWKVNKNWVLSGQTSLLCIVGEGLSLWLLALVTGDRRKVTGDMWHMTLDTGLLSAHLARTNFLLQLWLWWYTIQSHSLAFNLFRLGVLCLVGNWSMFDTLMVSLQSWIKCSQSQHYLESRWSLEKLV